MTFLLPLLSQMYLFDRDMFYLRFIRIIEVMVSISIGHTLWQDNALEHPEPKCALYSFIRGVLSEITSEELEHYISENPTVMMYMCTASNEICRDYEKSF